MSENVPVPLSAATTRYGSSSSCLATSGGGTTSPPRDRVGHVEQAAHEGAVALDDLLVQRLPVVARRGPLDDEPALRADRDDHRVLHRLRLHQPEHLGAEVLAPVGPADSSARDLAAAQVDRLRPRRVDEHLEHRPRLGQVGDQRRVELQREVRLRLPVGVGLEVVRPQHRADAAEEAAQDPVLVQARDSVDRDLELALERPRLDVASRGTSPGRAAGGRARRALARSPDARRARPPCRSG